MGIFKISQDLNSFATKILPNKYLLKQNMVLWAKTENKH